MSVRRTILPLLLAASTLLPVSARAETYETCANFIDSVPATITTQGVWCLRKNLATNITSGNAITIATNNVTIDCNDFKLGGLAAGDGSYAIGIYANARQNATVRHCNVRGFRYGIALVNSSGAGHLVEDNRLDNNLLAGIWVEGQNNLVQRNRVFDTGGHPDADVAYGMSASADIIDNTVAGVFAVGAANTTARGIVSRYNGAEVRGNRVRGLLASGAGMATGITLHGEGSKVAENLVTAEATTYGVGVSAFEAPYSACTGNVVVNFSSAYGSCGVSLDNLAP